MDNTNNNLYSLVSFSWHNSVPAPEDTTSKAYSLQTNEGNLLNIMKTVKKELAQLKPEEETKKKQLQEIVRRCKIYVAQLHTASLTSTTAKVMNVAGNHQAFFANEIIAARALRILAANLPDFDSSDFKDSFKITFTSTGDNEIETEEVLSLPKFYKKLLADKSYFWEDLCAFEDLFSLGGKEQTENKINLGAQITKENFLTLLKIVGENLETLPLDELGLDGLLDFIKQSDFFCIPSGILTADKAVLEVIKRIDPDDHESAQNLHEHLEGKPFLIAAKQQLDNYFTSYLIGNPEKAGLISGGIEKVYKLQICGNLRKLIMIN